MNTLAQGIGLGSLLLVSTAGITFGNNLLENHRFQQTEQGLPKVGAASTRGGEAKFEISSEGFHDQSSLMISSDRGADASWGQKVTLKPFTRYKLWGFIKTEGVKGEGLGAVFNIHGTEFKTRAVEGTSDWTYVECVFVSAGGEVMVNCLFGGGGHATGKAWFDDVRLESLGPVRYDPKFSRETAGRLTDQGIDKLVFVKRMKYQSNHYYTDYINSTFDPAGNICTLDLKTGEVRDVVKGLEGGVFGRFDLSYDAGKIVFCWKSAANEGYRLYECKIDGSGLKQLTFPEDNEAELVRKYQRGYHHGTDDMDPCYLPDGGICFISTRCQFGILCDSPDIFTTTVLYRIDADGGNMQKLTNSSVSEATPSVMNDGRIMYTRWEYYDKGAVSVKCLWAMHPDGYSSAEIYGADISLPPTITQGRAIPGENNLFVALGVPHYPQNSVGTVIKIDTTKSIRTREPMDYVTPDVDIRGEGGFTFLDKENRGNRIFKDPYPLSENEFLVSMNPEGSSWKNKINWQLYLLNGNGDAELIYQDGRIGCFMPMPLRERVKPPVLASSKNEALAKKNQAVCIVTDIYHGLEDVERGTIKYIRINEQMPRPWATRRLWGGDEYDQQHAVITKDTALGLKVQHGIVPVCEDGSAHFVVPADRNISFQVLDENFMEIQRERTYVNYRPGEVRSCIGCHETPDNSPKTRQMNVPMALKRLPSMPGPQPGEKTGRRAIHYAADVQPVLDKHCVECHGGDKPKGDLVLTGEETTHFSISYEKLMPERRGGQGRRSFDLIGPTIGENHPKTGNVHYLPARSLGSHASVLVAMLNPGKVVLKDEDLAKHAERLAKKHKELKLTQAEMVRLTTWIDSNGQYYGSYWGRRNKQYKDHPNYRPVPTFEEALSYTSPIPEDQR
jgi:hypothetical protein